MKKNINIYLAGKIKSNGWRQSIVDIRNNFIDYENHSVKTLKNAELYVDKIKDANVYITGPFFLSCDHSCFHGEENHGLGIKSSGCCDGYTFSEYEVIDICKAQIKRADIVIAYINDDTCYGTLFELGLAKQMGKQIVTIFDNKERKKKMWFIASNSDYTTTLFEDYSSFIYTYFESIEEAEAIMDIVDILKKWYMNEQFNKQHNTFIRV